MKKSRIILISSIFTILVIMTFADFIIRVNLNAHKEANSELENISTQACNAVDVTIENSILSLREISIAFLDMRSMEKQDVLEILQKVSESTPFTNMCIIDESGNGIFDNGEKRNLSDRDYYINGIKGQSGISEVITSAITGQKYLILYAPIYEQDGEVIGVVQGAYDMAALSKIIDVDSFDNQGNTYLFNIKGELILGSANVGNLDMGDNVFEYFEENVKFTEKEKKQFYDNIHAGISGFAHYEKEGIEYVGFYQPLNAEGWYIINVISHQLVASRILGISKFALSFFVKCLFFFCLMFGWVLRTERRRKQMELKIANEAHLSQLLQEQKKSNQLILESVKLAKQANRTKSEFLSRMSHEIKTPINAIIGMNEMARNNMENSDVQLTCFDRIDVASKELLVMYQRLLNHSEDEDKKLRLSDEIVNLYELLALVQKQMQEDINEKSLQINWQLQIPKEYGVITDGECLHLILVNILRNAIKYSPNNSEIIFKAELIEEAKSFAVCGFEVHDHMTDINQQELNELLDIYESGQRFHKESTGIELRIAYNLTILMNGLMTGKVVKGKGTIIHIDVPMRKAQTTATEEMTKNAVKPVLNALEKKEYHLAGKRILLVEDNDINMEIAKMYLEEVNIEIIPAVDGKIALQKYLDAPAGYFDMILTDIRMPNLDGRDLAKSVREAEHGDAATIPILAMSADAFSDDIKMSQSVGMDDYIMKPIQKEDLYDILKKYLVSSADDTDLEEVKT